MSHLEVSNVHNILLGLPRWPRGGIDQAKNLEIWVVGLFCHWGTAPPWAGYPCLGHVYHPVKDRFFCETVKLSVSPESRPKALYIWRDHWLALPFVLEILKIIATIKHIHKQPLKETALPKCFTVAERITLILQSVHIKIKWFVMFLGKKYF